jgi:alpha-beta hydrolase superfamily lysophospholipase
LILLLIAAICNDRFWLIHLFFMRGKELIMKYSEGRFAASGGLELFTRSWCPDTAPRALLAIVHGAGDHSGRFERLVQPLVAQGFAAEGFDLRGFGRSPGKKGHINAWDDYRQDVRLFQQVLSRRFPGTPLFLFGYSLGAAIVLDYVLHHPQGLYGAILSGTPIEPVGVATPLQIALARLLSRAWPGFTIRRGGDIHGVTRDAQVIAALQADPLHHDLVTARWGTEAMALTKWMGGQAGSVRLPLLFIHGEADPFNAVAGVQRFYAQIPFPDKALKIYPGSRHETHNDLDHAQVAADMIQWMEAHL